MRWSRLVLLVAALSLPASAEVQPVRARVEVEVTEPDAVQVDAAVLRRLLELELDADVSVGARGVPAPWVRIRVTPGNDADSVRATLHWCDAAPSVAESVALPATGVEARARALALVLGELNRSRPDAASPGAEVLRVPRLPRATDARADTVVSTTAPQPPTSSGLLISAAVGPRSYLSLGTTLLHAEAGVRLPLAREPRFSLRLDPGVDFGQREDALGRVQLFHAGLGVGVEFETTGELMRLAAGPRLEAGWLFATGVPRGAESAGASGNAFSMGAVFAVALRAPLYRSVLLQLEFEFGYGASGFVARGDDRALATNTGPLVGLRVGVLFPRP